MTRSSAWPTVGQSAWLWIAAAAGVAAGLVIGRASSPVMLLLLAVGGAAAALILARPEIGLLALVVASYTSLSNVLIQFHGVPSVTKLLAPLVILAILLRWARTGQRPEGWIEPTLLVSIYAFACTLSLLGAREPALTLEGLATMGKDAMILISVVILVRSGATLRRVVWALLGAALFMGTITMHQQLTGNFDFQYWGFGRTPIGFVFEGRTIRLGGPIGDPNFYGMIFLALVPLAIDRLQHEARPLLRVVAAWALLVSVFTIVFTYSRSALVSLIALLGLMVLVRRPRPRYLVGAALVTIALLPLAPGGYVQRFTELANSVVELGESGATREISVRGRLSENLVAIRMFQDHPVFGLGFGNFPARYQEYSRRLDFDPRSQDRSAHNLYLEVLAETGLVGFAAFGLLIWSVLRGAIAARRALLLAGRNDVAHLVEAFTLSVIGFLIASVFLHASHPRYFWLLTGIALALPAVAQTELSSEPPAGSLG